MGISLTSAILPRIPNRRQPSSSFDLTQERGSLEVRSPSDFCSDFSPKSISSSSPSSPLLPFPYHSISSTPDQTPLLINKFTQNHEKFSPALEKHNPALTFASAHLNLKPEQGICLNMRWNCGFP